MHQNVSALSGADQAVDGGLPLLYLLFRLRQSLNVVSGVLEGEKLATVRQGYGIIERGGPGHLCEQISAGLRELHIGAGLVLPQPALLDGIGKAGAVFVR
jgi:hypothetical protein